MFCLKPIRGLFFALLLLTLLLTPLFPQGGAAAQSGGSYKVVEIGVLSGFNASKGAGINESGQVVGTLQKLPFGAQTAFVWQQGSTLRALGKFEKRDTIGAAINDNGEVAGRALGLSVHDVGFAYIWNPSSGFRRLDAPPNQYGSDGTGVNNASQVSGSAATGSKLAARWEANGQVMLLGSLGGTQGIGYGINDDGQVVGWTTNEKGYNRPFLWDPQAGMRDLGTFNSNLTSSGTAYAINELSHVAGEASSGSFGRAFLWIDGQLIAVGPELSYAYALNNLDHVVGSFTVKSKSRAFLYRDGTFSDLNSLIPKNKGILLTEARGINNDGWIVANGTNARGLKRAFVLIPQ